MQITVSYSQPHLQSIAKLLAEQLQINCVLLEKSNVADFCLVVTENHIELRAPKEKFNPIHIDFLSGSNAYRRQHGGGIKQTIAKAVGIKQGYRPTIIDATAGLGRDAFVFAGLGCQVTMIEQSPVLATLLTDALQRFYIDEKASRNIRLALAKDNSIHYLKNLTAANYPDTIYLDPMYPQNKNSADVKKEMQMLRQLIGKNDDSAELLALALQRAVKRVVVKRPKVSDYLTTNKPDVELFSKNHRFDIYLIK